jgi:hypothetical protein
MTELNAQACYPYAPVCCGRVLSLNTLGLTSFPPSFSALVALTYVCGVRWSPPSQCLR